MSSQYEQFDTNRLKAISITEVARRLGDQPRKVGANHVAHCPWHEDKHPSLSIVEGTGKNVCHCCSCNKGGDVIAYTMQRGGFSFQEACQWLSQTFGISTLLAARYFPRPKPQPVMKPVETVYTYIPTEMVDALISTDSSLCQCLMQMFPSEAVEWITEEYRLGSYSLMGHDDYTVFPSIDAQGRVCNLKVQHYDTNPTSARFAHNDQKTFWLGKMWANEGRLPKDAQFKSRCLFGEHLLSRYPQCTVVLVESPKNALFGALAYPKLLWVAAGNKTAISPEDLKPLQGRDVIVIPDRDAIGEWQDKTNRMAWLANFSVSDFCERMAPDGQTKFDIADYLQQQLMAPPF